MGLSRTTKSRQAKGKRRRRQCRSSLQVQDHASCIWIGWVTSHVVIAAWHIQLAKAETALSHNPLPSISVFDQKSRVGGAEQRARRRRRRRRVGVLARPRKFVRSLEAARFTFALFDMCASERGRECTRSLACSGFVRPSGAVSPLCRRSGRYVTPRDGKTGKIAFWAVSGIVLPVGDLGFAFCTRPCMKWERGGRVKLHLGLKSLPMCLRPRPFLCLKRAAFFSRGRNFSRP